MTNKTLTDVANTQPGQFVSGKFTATMSKTAERQSKSGNAFYKAILSDGIATIDVTSFSRDLRPFEGQLVTIGGMGIKRGEDYKGTAQISLGDKAVISSQGSSIANPADVGAPIARAMAAENKPMRVEGITIGACLNKAVDIAISTGTVDEDSIWKLASRLLRIQNRLATGDIEGLAK
jgi:hypothetical protein